MNTILHKQKNEISNLKKQSSIIADEEKNIRQSDVLKLYIKGFSQTEIAQKLLVNQSTISRDLQEIKKESKKYIVNIICKDIPFEFKRTLTGLDEVIKFSWKLIENEESNKVSDKEKCNILNLLQSLYSKRLQLIIGGEPKETGDSSLNLINSFRGIKVQETYGLGL